MRPKQGLLSTLLTILIHDIQKQNPSMQTANEAMKHLTLVDTFLLVWAMVSEVWLHVRYQEAFKAFYLEPNDVNKCQLKKLFQQLQTLTQDSSSCSNCKVVELPSHNAIFFW